MSEYTPTTVEVRHAYGDARCADADDPAHANGCPQDAEFDRWLAEHDRQVKAEALREAADSYVLGHIAYMGFQPGYTQKWLRARADALEEAAR